MYVRIFLSDAKAREKPCLRCGLSLRKHLDERHCPQCGLSTWLSLNGNDSLDSSHPHWLRKMAQGAWILAAAQVLAWLAALLVLGSWATSTAEWAIRESQLYAEGGALPPEYADDPEAYGEAYAPPAPSRLLAVGAGMTGLALAGCAAGLALLTRHEGRYPDRARVVRLGSTITAAVAGLLGIALLARALAHLETGWPFWAMENTAWRWGAEILFVALAVCQWAWLRRMAQRAAHWTLARICGYLLFLPVIPLLKLSPILGVWFLVVIGEWLVPLLPIVYFPASAVALIWFAFLFQRTSVTAEDQWTSETRPPQHDSAPAQSPA